MRYTRFAVSRFFVNLAAICLPDGAGMVRPFVLLMAANTAIKREIAALEGASND